MREFRSFNPNLRASFTSLLEVLFVLEYEEVKGSLGNQMLMALSPLDKVVIKYPLAVPTHNVEFARFLALSLHVSNSYYHNQVMAVCPRRGAP